jgi:myo-inositol-1(or 4)-monophosphatase
MLINDSMDSIMARRALSDAVQAARAAGALMRANLRSTKKVNAATAHDIKLELDVRCQRTIERILHRAFPEAAVLGEEGVAGKADAEYRWVVDPIDGTVNFAYGIPHACVSIALQTRNRELGTRNQAKSPATRHSSHVTLLGVVYDPFQDEMWTATRGGPARLNGRTIRVSRRRKLREAVVSIGFTKSRETLQAMLPHFCNLVHRVRKVRMMGAAALGLTYVASGRFDAYLECEISLWDIAAGGLIIEAAGGEFRPQPIPGEHKYSVIATNGLITRQLPKLI